VEQITELRNRYFFEDKKANTIFGSLDGLADEIKRFSAAQIIAVESGLNC
jgi:hypothetical protein